MQRHFKQFFNKNNITDDLSVSFEGLRISENMAQIAQIEAALAELKLKNDALTAKVQTLEECRTTFLNSTKITEYSDITTTYTNGDGIQLDAFKVIPEFNGDKKVYRSWRTQVHKLMTQIADFKAHPKYAAALAIIRAKITKGASDILINNNTAHNIDAIIDRLDFSYADQRPLYVIEAEMTMIKQRNHSLQEYYDEINQALNMVLTKIAMCYKGADEQKSLTTETQQKAIRTFITGLNSTLIRTTLYGNMPKTLAQAFAIAQTIQYDNQHLQLDQQFKVREQPKEMKKIIDNKPVYHPNFRYQPQQSTQAPKRFELPHFKQQQKPTPMEVDESKRFIQQTQFQQQQRFPYNPPMKRERDPSFQNMNKQQRVNHLDGTDEIQSIYHHDSMDNNCEETENFETDSTISNQESTFLEE